MLVCELLLINYHKGLLVHRANCGALRTATQCDSKSDRIGWTHPWWSGAETVDRPQPVEGCSQ